MWYDVLLTESAVAVCCDEKGCDVMLIVQCGGCVLCCDVMWCWQTVLWLCAVAVCYGCVLCCDVMCCWQTVLWLCAVAVCYGCVLCCDVMWCDIDSAVRWLCAVLWCDVMCCWQTVLWLCAVLWCDVLLTDSAVAVCCVVMWCDVLLTDSVVVVCCDAKWCDVMWCGVDSAVRWLCAVLRSDVMWRLVSELDYCSLVVSVTGADWVSFLECTEIAVDCRSVLRMDCFF